MRFGLRRRGRAEAALYGAGVEGVTVLVGGSGNSASRIEEGARSPVVRVGWEGGGAMGLRLELGSRGLSVGSRRRRSQLKRGRVWGR